MVHPLAVAPVTDEQHIQAQRLTADQVRRGLARLHDLGISSGPTYELVRQRALTLGVPVKGGDSSLADRSDRIPDRPAQNDTIRQARWIETPLQGGYVYWQLAGRPLAVAPWVGMKKGKQAVDTGRWQIVYLFDAEAEPITEAVLTLAGAKRLAECLDGDSLVDLQHALQDAINTTRPADFADYADRVANSLRVGNSFSHWADGRFRTRGGHA